MKRARGKGAEMDWKSTRLWVTVSGMGCAQWGLVAQLIDAQVWMAVMMVCLGAFGIAKTVEYAKSGRAENPESRVQNPQSRVGGGGAEKE